MKNITTHYAKIIYFLQMDYPVLLTFPFHTFCTPNGFVCTWSLQKELISSNSLETTIIIKVEFKHELSATVQEFVFLYNCIKVVQFNLHEIRAPSVDVFSLLRWSYTLKLFDFWHLFKFQQWGSHLRTVWLS